MEIASENKECPRRLQLDDQKQRWKNHVTWYTEHKPCFYEDMEVKGATVLTGRSKE